MLYVFLVDSGTMYTFEMELAMERVEALMQAIQEEALVPVDKQVLLVTGGRALLPGNRVCSYTSAGTEDNPIFMFSKSSIEAAIPPSPSLIMGSEASLKDQVEASLRLPSTYETLVSRAKLASEFQCLAVDLSDGCSCLVHDQVLQQQGWIAVVANLENITRDFSVHARAFESIYGTFLSKKQQYVDILTGFDDILNLLSKIPILPTLLSSEDSTKLPPGKSYSLLDWINAQDEKSSLEAIAEQCKQALSQFDSNVLKNLMSEVQSVLDASDNTSMKEIKGLDERQAGLQQLLLSVTHLTQEQADLAKGFQQNQARALNVGDPSVLPDLCAGHQKQLLQLLKKHSHLRDLRKRCARAKDELSTNLHARLRWVMFTEKKICDCDSNLILHHEHLKRLKCRLDILEQVYNTPKLYITTIAEIIRRKNFSQHFLNWASEVLDSSEQVHSDELTRRHNFAMFFEHHFLRNLFKGLDDKPEKLFSHPLSVFDSFLPAVTEEDLAHLQDNVPELSNLLLDIRESQEVTARSTEAILSHEFSGHDLELLKLPVSSRLCKSDEGVYKTSVSGTTKEMSKDLTDGLNKSSELSMKTLKHTEWEIGEETDEAEVVENITTITETSDSEDGIVIKISDAEFSTDEDDVSVKGKFKRKTKKQRSILRQVLENVPNEDPEDSNGNMFHSASEKFIDEDSDGGKEKKDIEEKDTTGNVENISDDISTSVDKGIQTECDQNEDAVASQGGTDYQQMGAGSSQLETGRLQAESDALQDGAHRLHAEADTQESMAGTLSIKADTKDIEVDDAQLEPNTQTGEGQQGAAVGHLKQEGMEVRPCTSGNLQVSKNEDIRTELLELYKTKELLEQTIKDQENSLSGINNQLSVMEESSQQLQQQNVTLKTGCREMRTVLKEEFLLLRQKLKDSRDEITCIKTEIKENSSGILSQLNDRIEKERTLGVENILSETKMEYDNLLKSTREKFVAENQALLIAKRQLENEYNQVKHELELVKKEKQEIKLKLEDVKQNNTTIIAEYNEKIGNLKKTISDMQEARLQFVAEQQVNFNNAVSKVVKEKDHLCLEFHEKIESLESQNDLSIEKISSLQQKCDEVQQLREQELERFSLQEKELFAKQKELEEKLVEVERLMKVKEKYFAEELEKEKKSQLLLLEIEKQTWEDEKQKLIQEKQQHVHAGDSSETMKLHNQIQELQKKISQLQEENETLMSQSMNKSTATVTPEQSVHELTEMLKARDEQCHVLKSQLFQERKPSIALQDFKIGDNALFVFDEGRENYLIYTVSPMLYFLHANSLESLGLSTAPGKRRSHFVARIVDKEFVEAKKPNNRFRVPVGTRFFRVQAQFL